MATLTTNTTARDGLLAFVFSAFASLRDEIQRRRVYRNTVTELSRLSYRELDDLGIARGDIARVAREAAGY